MEKAERSAKDRGLLLDFLSSGYADAKQPVLQSFGQANVETMKSTAAKYDPDGLFQKLQGGGFLLRDC